ncbi:MAG: carboxymuconolactone decarboxylase family protein [Nitrospiraceae bacterium]
MHLDLRTKELIAVGASVAVNCQPCLEYHRQEAQTAGATLQDIADALDVGKMVRRGAALKMDCYATALLESAPPPTQKADADCGCH